MFQNEATKCFSKAVFVYRLCAKRGDSIANSYEPQARFSPVKHVSLVRVASDQPVHFDGFVLTNPMTASLCLEVILRVPVRVIDDDRVSCCEVNTETARTSTQQEHKAIRIWGGGRGEGYSCAVFLTGSRTCVLCMLAHNHGLVMVITHGSTVSSLLFAKQATSVHVYTNLVPQRCPI